MDPLRTLFADLHSPDPSIRFSVLSRVEDLEWTEEQLAGLRNLAAQEKDPGTRFHMRKILARIEREKGRDQAPPPTAQEVRGLLRNTRRDDLSLALLLSALPRQEGPAVVQTLRETRWPESNPAVLPSILHFLKKHGGPEDVGAIESLCRHSDPRVLAAAVETLEKLNPERLKDLIVPLLVNPIHGIRSRAVRLLYRWDPQEALRHFEAMLFSEDPDDRQAALFHAFFFPFPEIEPLMVKFLGMENDPDMLERAGFLFRANPAPEEPLRLLEAREASLGEKKRLIGEILAGVVDSLYQAGLVQKRPADLLAELEGIFFRRRALQLLDSYQLSLQAADPDDRRDAALRLAELIQRGFREAIPILEAWLGKETDPQLKALLTARLQCLVPAPRPEAGKEPARPGELLPPAKPAAGPERAVSPQEPPAASLPPTPPGATVPASRAAPAVAATPAPEPDLTKLPAEDRTRVLVALDRERLKKISPILGTILKVCPVEEKLLILQGFARSGEKADAPKLQGFLTDSDPRLVVAAIEALRDLDPDLLSPHLPRLIQHSSDQVRATAMRVFALFDKKQAISLVEKMLFSLQPKQRALAIFSTGQVDFPSVRDLLLRALVKEQIPENARQICTILRAHLDEELVMGLGGSLAACPEATRDTLEAFFTEAVETLRREERTRFAGVEEFRQEAKRRIAAEEQRQKSAQPSYALKNIQKMRQQKAAEAPKVDAGLVQFTVAAFGIGAVLTALIWFLFLAPAAPPADNGSAPVKRPVSTPPTQGQAPRNIEGVVTEIGVGGQIEVKGEGPDGERFLIECRDSGIPIPAKGSRFRGQIRPTGQEGKVVLAELLAIY